ncbi:MAG: VWA domain-containing protein [Candidatus Glassbacteria bacterium]
MAAVTAICLLLAAAAPLPAVFDKLRLDNKTFINIILILDCSASMNKIIGPVRKIDIAKKTVETIIKNLAIESHEAGSMKAGLRVFGSKFYKWKQNCDDTSLEVALGEIDNTINPILVKVTGITAKGQSSLSLTIDALKGDFPEQDQECNFIVVISDGDESCGGNPCSAVKQLVGSGEGISVNTIGVQTDAAGYDNLNCMAQAGNGLYFDSKDVDKFVLHLKDVNRQIQENRRAIAAAAPADTTVITKRDVTANMTEYKVDSASPLYPDKDDRFPAIDTLRPEDKVFLISTRGLWVEVFAPQKRLQGWILAKTGGSQYSVTVTDDKTPLYMEKSLSSEVATYLDAGFQLTVLKKEGAWYNVFNQQTNVRGWVLAFNVVEN